MADGSMRDIRRLEKRISALVRTLEKIPGLKNMLTEVLRPKQSGETTLETQNSRWGSDLRSFFDINRNAWDDEDTWSIRRLAHEMGLLPDKTGRNYLK
jgi:hypothetical protein